MRIRGPDSINRLPKAILCGFIVFVASTAGIGVYNYLAPLIGWSSLTELTPVSVGVLLIFDVLIITTIFGVLIPEIKGEGLPSRKEGGVEESPELQGADWLVEVDRLVDFIVRHELLLGTLMTAAAGIYFLWGVFGRYPWHYFGGWTEAYYFVEWEKMLARIGGALWWLFIAFLFIGLPLLYMANQKRRKGSQKGSQRAET